jgi:hypothetical protein
MWILGVCQGYKPGPWDFQFFFCFSTRIFIYLVYKKLYIRKILFKDLTSTTKIIFYKDKL